MQYVVCVYVCVYLLGRKRKRIARVENSLCPWSQALVMFLNTLALTCYRLCQSPFGFVWCVEHVDLVPFSDISCIQYMECVYNPAPTGHQGSPLPLKRGAACFGLFKLPTHSLTKDRVRPYWSPGARL